LLPRVYAEEQYVYRERFLQERPDHTHEEPAGVAEDETGPLSEIIDAEIRDDTTPAECRRQ
jgi:hypothetical protein